jgi:lysine biosynthesis protein LysW
MLLTKNIKCPSCSKKVELESSLEAGEVISCPHCNIDHEVVQLDPPRLQKADDEEDDFAYDEDDDFADEDLEDDEDFEDEDFDEDEEIEDEDFDEESVDEDLEDFDEDVSEEDE